VRLAVVQPSLRREWELRRDGEVAATLRRHLFRRGATAELAGRPLMIKREGGLRSEYAVLDATTGEQLARFRPERTHHVLELRDRTVQWRRLGRREGHGFVGAGGEPLLRAKVSSGIARTNGEVEVADELPEEEALVAALLAAYLLIRRAEEASSAGATAAVS
jgi:hypothetical protein